MSAPDNRERRPRQGAASRQNKPLLAKIAPAVAANNPRRRS
jgi:hypothetical protein